MTILVFRDENEIPFCYSHVSRRDRDFRKSFLVVEREKMKLTLVENSRDREFSLTSDWNADVSCEGSTSRTKSKVCVVSPGGEEAETFINRVISPVNTNQMFGISEKRVPVPCSPEFSSVLLLHCKDKLTTSLQYWW